MRRVDTNARLIIVYKNGDNMKILIGSDFHMEHRDTMSSVIPEYTYYQHFDVIVLAGDIDGHYKVGAFLKDFCSTFSDSIVIYTPGNHEFYSVLPENTIGVINKKLKNLENDIPNLRVGINEVVEVNDVAFYVGTMWSDINCKPEYQTIPFQEKFLIHTDDGSGLTPESCRELFNEYAEGLHKFLLSDDYKRKVVVSHFSPSLDFNNPMIPKGDSDHFMSYYFSADLDYILDNKEVCPELWIYGHTHYSMDRTLESGCRVISCQLGYPKEGGGNWGDVESIDF